METLIIIGLILVLLGIVGSIVPAMPGPIFSFIGLLLLFFAKGAGTISIGMLIIFGVTMVLLSILDYVAPILGAKYAGSSKRGIWGAIIGAFAGIVFFPPLGIFLGALIGAVLGEFTGGKKIEEAMKAAVGVVMGSVMMIVLQTIYSVIVVIYFFVKVF